MSVQNFALDPTGSQRIQIHWSSESSTITVLLNGSIIGTLDAVQDGSYGKDFTLPDNSPLHVQMINGWPQCWRFGQPLPPVAAEVSPEVKAPKKRGGCLTTFWIFLIVVLAISAISNVSSIFGANALLAGVYFVLALINIAGIVGLGALLAWKKWGFYVCLGVIVANIVLTLVAQPNASGLTQCAFIVLSAGSFYYWLNRRGIWENLQ